MLCLSCITYCPVFETKARINALIPFDAISRSKSIDLQQKDNFFHTFNPYFGKHFLFWSTTFQLESSRFRQKKQVYSAWNFQSPFVKGDKASAWKNRVLPVGDNDALTGTPHRVPSEDRSRVQHYAFPAELSVLILFKMIESIDMTLCVISFLVLNWQHQVTIIKQPYTAINGHWQPLVVIVIHWQHLVTI